MDASNSKFRIVSVQNEDQLNAAKALFIAYTKWLGIDLTFQNFASELQALPGKYCVPQGELLLAYSTNGEKALGCVAVRPLSHNDRSENQHGSQEQGGCCEMKRLYVSPEARGLGLGKALIDTIVKRAKELGYREMRLDTLPFMAGAIQLYKRVGFVEIPPYYETPLEGTLFLSLDLT
ncbi:hypothetical protein EYZ11_006021 [Aspergillus tanneri]|uniref:N-acetyltransferase domain-containing protein n=1 Tax=Aspergillus tanneri TaxID=1220188 RepID=A0A4S3JIZ2_9EURO|nr:uncharacterized protein ATNIH1004_000301 [Aspergillus tanneri]KAA8651419.1 hypothetical protein ATNIH1004_000301 [Aspergillus tanneri]THC94498.1 hypothetical protein EYZ11_006021 [Aspergillus tanneri]